MYDKPVQEVHIANCPVNVKLVSLKSASKHWTVCTGTVRMLFGNAAYKLFTATFSSLWHHFVIRQKRHLIDLRFEYITFLNLLSWSSCCWRNMLLEDHLPFRRGQNPTSNSHDSRTAKSTPSHAQTTQQYKTKVINSTIHNQSNTVVTN
jgi:hypothetical protein